MKDRHDIGKYVLNALKKGGADESSVRITDSVLTEIYYESGKISLIRTNANVSVNIKALKDKKKGLIAVNSVDTDALDEAVTNVLLSLESSPADEAEGICDEVVTVSKSSGPLKPDKEPMFESMKTLVDECAVRYPKVRFDNIERSHTYNCSLYMNSLGADITSESGAYDFSAVFLAKDGEKASSFSYTVHSSDDPTAPLLSLGMNEQLIAECEQQIDTVSVGDKYVGEVILAPICFSEVLGSIVNCFLDDVCMIQGTSLYRDKLEKKVASDCFSLSFEPCNPLFASHGIMTGEGYIAKDAEIITNGVLKSFALSRYGAKRTNQQRCPSDAGYYVVANGDKSLAELIASTKNGLLVNRFSGGEPAANGEFSGTAKNSFLIKDGKLCGAVSETMVSGNLADMLLNVRGISSETVNTGQTITPWIKVGGITISGK